MPPENFKRPITKKVMHCVFFFGSYDYGWLAEADLKPYQEFKSEMKTTKKSVKKAIDEIESYIKDGCKMNAANIVAMSKDAVVTPVRGNLYLKLQFINFMINPLHRLKPNT